MSQPENPSAFPDDWKMRESAHINGGREWFAYEYQCIQEPRLRRLDRYTRKDRSVASTWRVDGENCASIDDAISKISEPPVVGEDELAVLAELESHALTKDELVERNIDWRNRRDSLGQKGLIIWQAGTVCRTPLADAMLAERAKPVTVPAETLQHVAYFDEGQFHWMSGIAPRDCELFAKAKGGAA